MQSTGPATLGRATLVSRALSLASRALSLASHTLSLAAAWLVLGAVPGCFVFDASLYMQRDGGIDASTPETDAGGGDGGGADSGGPDAGAPTVVLADFCTDTVPMLEIPDGTSLARYEFDTTSLSNDLGAIGCTGRSQPGDDGFFAVRMRSGERWHFHVRHRDPMSDPSIYVLSTCDERTCTAESGLDVCRTAADEHMSFVAPSTGTFFVGLDNGTTGGFAATVEIIRPTCGNTQREHSETCDDGDVESGDGCDSQCRAELASGASEIEVNDDWFSANVLSVVPGSTFTLSGAIGSVCEIDTFAIDVSDGGSVRASVLSGAGVSCSGAVPDMELQLLAPNGLLVRGSGMPRDGNLCPSITDADGFATGLAAGRYYVRVYSLDAELRGRFDYQLRIDVQL